MSFDASEISNQDGKPAFLLRIFRTGKAWYYTNADQDIVFDGNTYTAVPATVTSVIQSGDAKAENLEITLPSSAPLCVYLDMLTPTSQISAILRKVHMIEDSSDGSFTVPTEVVDAPVVWVGEYISLRRTSLNARVLVCNTLSLSMARGGLRLSWGRNCPHMLYGRGCNLEASLYRVDLTSVTVVDGITLAAAEFGLDVHLPFSVSATDAGTTLAPWTYTGLKEYRGMYRDVRVDPDEGNPAPSYQLVYDEISNGGDEPAMYRDFGIGGASTINASVDFKFTRDVTSHRRACFIVGADVSGAGAAAFVDQNWNLYILRTSHWSNYDAATLVGSAISGGLDNDLWYTLKVDITAGSGDVQTVTATIKHGATVLGTVSTTDSFTKGGYMGLTAAASADSSDKFATNFDNISVSASGERAVGGFAGGFIEWESEAGVLERIGIESESAGSVVVLGSTQGMSLGVGGSFRAYPGCNRTASQCNTKFGNLLNFGGINHLQGKSPFSGDPIFY